MSSKRLVAGAVVAIAAATFLVGGTVFGIEVWKWMLAAIGVLICLNGSRRIV